MTTFNEDVEINGSLDVLGVQDVPQLEVRGTATQTAPLQTWKEGSGGVLARLAGDGRLELGTLDMGTPDALVEANRTITLPSTVPQRGMQSQGRITADDPQTLGDGIAWSVHELELLGNAVMSGIHAALRGKATRKNTGTGAQAELRAADFEAINDTASGTNPLGKLVGVQSTVTNEQTAYLTEAVGVDVQIQNEGAANHLTHAYGVRVADMPAAEADAYAIYTGSGSVHVGDDVEQKVFSSAPAANPPTGFIKLYPKLETGIPRLYAKDASGIEHGLSPAHMALFYVAGILDIGAGPMRIYNVTGAGKTLTKVFLACKTAPTGAAIIVDVHKNGTSIFTNPANRPQVAAGQTTGQTTVIDVSSWGADEYLTVEIDQVGSAVKGEDLVVHVVYL